MADKSSTIYARSDGGIYAGRDTPGSGEVEQSSGEVGNTIECDRAICAIGSRVYDDNPTDARNGAGF